MQHETEALWHPGLVHRTSLQHFLFTPDTGCGYNVSTHNVRKTLKVLLLFVGRNSTLGFNDVMSSFLKHLQNISSLESQKQAVHLLGIPSHCQGRGKGHPSPLLGANTGTIGI